MAKVTKIYAVGAVKTQHKVCIAGTWKQYLDFKEMAEGCCGVLMCFTNKKKAKKYAGKKYPILTFIAEEVE